MLRTDPDAVVIAEVFSKKSKRERLKAAGWRVGDASNFVGLTKEEAAFVEMKLTLADSKWVAARG